MFLVLKPRLTTKLNIHSKGTNGAAATSAEEVLMMEQESIYISKLFIPTNMSTTRRGVRIRETTQS
jgi:hypothetical protein